jgi:hypothetical protein
VFFCLNITVLAISKFEAKSSGFLKPIFRAVNFIRPSEQTHKQPVELRHEMESEFDEILAVTSVKFHVLGNLRLYEIVYYCSERSTFPLPKSDIKSV